MQLAEQLGEQPHFREAGGERTAGKALRRKSRWSLHFIGRRRHHVAVLKEQHRKTLGRNRH